jgi:hypothetical protein
MAICFDRCFGALYSSFSAIVKLVRSPNTRYVLSEALTPVMCIYSPCATPGTYVTRPQNRLFERPPSIGRSASSSSSSVISAAENAPARPYPGARERPSTRPAKAFADTHALRKNPPLSSA